MKDKKVDIIAVANAARVSPATVSRSFNHPNMVNAATRKKIDSAVRKLGYIRNRAAQTIHGIRSGTVGLIVPTVDHTIFAELIQSYSEAIEKMGFTILLASHRYNLEREYALTRKMLEHRVDGIALVGSEHAQETFDLLKQQSMPTVLLWNYTQNAPFSCVGSDNRTAGHLIGEHIVQLGHKEIALVFPPIGGNDRAADRLRGVENVLAQHNIAMPPKWHLEIPYSVGSAKAAVSDMLQGPDRPKAIICGNDVLAWGSLHAITKCGLSCPRDITVTGIGDFKGSGYFEPPLTTIRIPARQIGQRAAHHMVQAITNPDECAQHELIEPSLMVRSTSLGAD